MVKIGRQPTYINKYEYISIGYVYWWIISYSKYISNRSRLSDILLLVYGTEIIDLSFLKRT
jgi:hypothetical protein